MMDAELPWVCPEHPNAQIRHEWDHTQLIQGGYPAGQGFTSNHTYHCNECGRRLAAEKQKQEASDANK